MPLPVVYRLRVGEGEMRVKSMPIVESLANLLLLGHDTICHCVLSPEA
jgi:hypothetical protein